MLFRSTPRIFLATSDSGIFRRIPLPVPGRLYVSPMPYGAYDVHGRVLKSYRRHRVRHVVVLVTGEELAKKARGDLLRAYADAGISVSRHPIRDFQSTELEVVEALVHEIEDHLLSGQRLAVHCHAGVGRTALVAACVACRVDAMSGDQAIAHVRGNMQVRMTDEQVALVRRFSLQNGAPARLASGVGAGEQAASADGLGRVRDGRA